MINDNNNLLNFQDPGALDDELLNVPGFINELTDHTLSQAYSPNRALAFFGATAMLAHLAGRTSSSLSERVRRLYSASAGMYSVRSTARLPEGAVIVCPHLTMFATGTPEAFYNTLDSRAIVNGLFGRCLVLEIRDNYTAHIPTTASLPDTLVDTGKWLVAHERNAEEHDALDLITVGETPSVTAARASAANFLMEQRRRLSEMELYSARALVVRMSEKIAKLAMIYAISESPENPLISTDAITWDTKFVTHITKAMLFETQFHVAEGKFDALVKRFIGLLTKHGGSLDRRRLLQSLHIDHITFHRIVTTLLLCDAIIEETECGRNAVYTLKK